MARFDLKKVLGELEKATTQEQIDAYKSVKEFVINQLINIKNESEEKTKNIQKIIDEISNSN